MDTYVPDKFGRRSGRKYGFVRFGEKEKGEKAIEGMNGKFVGGHKLDVPSCDSSIEDGEEIDSTLPLFDGPLELEFQLHEKSERCKPSNMGKKSSSKKSKSNHESPTPTEIAKEALDFGKSLGISVIGNEAPTIRKITRSLRKELENKRQSKG
ncbi:hypothetical protein Cgig2_023391 [Carnegiea gigantea]|uniref:RRM domain-containing protein n=1 Tax=Carnegiea gigantea TaxID=171969 RepID=A0A9Q1JH13_9CARY|nr:hypothetical protein Cgig2_023391 [Carnegiea gigantea]